MEYALMRRLFHLYIEAVAGLHRRWWVCAFFMP